MITFMLPIKLLSSFMRLRARSSFAISIISFFYVIVIVASADTNIIFFSF